MDTSVASRYAVLATLALGLPACDASRTTALLSKPLASPAQAAQRDRPDRTTARRVGLILDRAVDRIADGFDRAALNR